MSDMNDYFRLQTPDGEVKRILDSSNRVLWRRAIEKSTDESSFEGTRSTQLKALERYGLCTQPSGTWNTAITQEGKCEQAPKEYLDTITQEGKVEQRNLPSGYTELGYIRSDGNQYINLNTAINQDDTIEIEFEITTSQKAKSIFGYRAGPSSNNIMLFFGGTTNQVFIDFNNSDYSPYRLSYDVSANTRYKTVISKSRRAILSADGTVLAENTTVCSDMITCPSVYLFSGAGNPAYADGSACRVYSCVINGKRDLVGAKDATNVVEMYDKVSAAPFVNAGTGTFTAGPNAVPSPEHPIDIVCNNGAMKYSANMANVNEQTARIGYYINTSGAVLADIYNWMYQAFVPVKPNTTYTLSMSASVYFVSISEYSTAEDSGFVVRKTGRTGSNTSLTITTEANTNYIRFGTNVNREEVTLEKVLAIDWMLNVGGTAMDYQPYVEGGIYTDGTPEVLTVRGKNLFDQGCFDTDVGTVITYDSFDIPNGTYTFSTDFPGKNSGGAWYTNVFIMAGEQTSGASTANNGVYDSVPRTITVTDGKFTVAYRSTGTINTNNPADYNWMLVSGSSVAEYEPYVTPQTVGWKNLFNKNDYTEINAYVNANTGVLTAGSSGSNTQYCAVIPCKPNTQYNITGQGASMWGAFTSDSIGTTATAFTKGGNLTTGANDRYLIGLVRANGDSIDYRNTLVVRETVTDIPMLLGVGDYKDAAELISGVKTGRVGVRVFDGTETFTVSSSGAMITEISDVAVGALNVPMNTHFALEISATSIAVGAQRFGANGTKIYSQNYYMKHPTITTVADFKAWLAAQYAAGSPVIVLYPLATTTTEQISNKIAYRNTDAQISYTAEVSDITITTTQSEKSTPTPNTPLDIVCNNGKLVWNGTTVAANGTPEVLIISGTNLLDPSTSNIIIGEIINVQGQPATATNNWRTDYIPVAGGKTYIFYGRRKADNIIAAYCRMNFYAADKTFISPRPSYEQNTPTVATAPSNAAYVRLSSAPYNSANPVTRDTFDDFNWMFAEANSEIPYVPYVQPRTVTDIPMLLDVGDYKDAAELINGIKTGKVGVYVFTGQETVTKGPNVFTVDNLLSFPASRFTPFCTRYEGVISTTTIAADSNKMRMYITTNQIRRIGFAAVRADYETGADLAADWARWYAEGKPMILVYPLATETTEQITAYPQLCNKLYNTADVTAEVDDISVTFTTGEQTVPSPYSQLPIMCNNGELKWNGTSVVAVGTPEVLTVGGQNLVDLTAVTNGYYYDPNGVLMAADVARLSGYIPVRAGQKYTAYVKAQQGGAASNVRCNMFNTEKVWKSQSVFVVTSGNSAVSTITPAADGFLRVSANYTGTGAKVDWSTLQIVRGEYTLSTMPSYQSYVEPQTSSVENLLAVGDYKDVQELISGLLTHKVGVKILDGTEGWTKGSVGSLNYYYGGDTNLDGNAEKELMCNQFAIGTRNVPAIGKICVRNARNGFLITPNDQTLDTTAKFKQWLAAQYAAGTPVIVLYPLATETTESVTPQPIQQNIGLNSLNSSALILGSYLTTYYGE